MKKSLVLLLTVLMLLSILAPALAETRTINLDTMTIEELAALQSEINTQLTKLRSESTDYTLVTAKTYSDYAKNPDAHGEEKISINGEIVQVIEGDIENEYRIAVDGNSDMIFYVTSTVSDDTAHFIDDEKVVVNGVFGGLISYNSTLGGKITVPSCDADEMYPFSETLVAYTRENPAPVGLTTIFPGEKYGNSAVTEITVTNVLRGDAALAVAKTYSRWNRPDKGYEYVIVRLHVATNSAPDGKAEINDYDFQFVSASGKEMDRDSIYGYNDELSDIYEGASQDAYIMCQIDPDDRPMMVYNQDSDTPIWFDLNTRQEVTIDPSTLQELSGKSTGAPVEQMQLMLAELGYYKKAVTGTYDSSTKKAVQAYQKAMGLKVTGIADVETLAQILSGKMPEAK